MKTFNNIQARLSQLVVVVLFAQLFLQFSDGFDMSNVF